MNDGVLMKLVVTGLLFNVVSLSPIFISVPLSRMNWLYIQHFLTSCNLESENPFEIYDLYMSRVL